MSAIVIMFLLTTITIGLGMSSFFGRFNILDSESKERSLALAEACVDSAILNIAQDASYNPSSESVVVGSVSCTIISVASSGSNKIIKTRGIFNQAYTNLKVEINNNDLSIESWQECANIDILC